MLLHCFNKLNSTPRFTFRPLIASNLNVKSKNLFINHNQIRTLAVGRSGGPPSRRSGPSGRPNAPPGNRAAFRPGSRPGSLRSRLLIPNRIKKDVINDSKSNGKSDIIKNQNIRYPTLRVIYTDVDTGSTVNEILSRKEALDLAYDMKLELVLVSSSSDPPVCKLIDNKVLMAEAKEKLKRKKSPSSTQSKQITIGAAIADGDYHRKLNQIIDFVSKGFQVSLVIRARRIDVKNNVTALEELALKALGHFKESKIEFTYLGGSNPTYERRFNLFVSKQPNNK